MTTELKQIFYRFLYYFWGQHCCWTVASIIGYDFYAFHKFPLPSTFLLPLSPIDVPASLVSLLFHLCDHFSIFAILPLPYFSITILVGSQIFWWLMMGNKKGPNTNVLHYELRARLSILCADYPGCFNFHTQNCQCFSLCSRIFHRLGPMPFWGNQRTQILNDGLRQMTLALCSKVKHLYDSSLWLKRSKIRH